MYGGCTDARLHRMGNVRKWRTGGNAGPGNGYRRLGWRERKPKRKERKRKNAARAALTEVVLINAPRAKVQSFCVLVKA